MAKKKVKIDINQVVTLRNGKRGVVLGFNNKPFIIVFDSFTSPINRFDETTYKHKNENYDIVAIHDGSSVENAKDVYKVKFDIDTLPLLWKE
jgi:hypothetical protein